MSKTTRIVALIVILAGAYLGAQYLGLIGASSPPETPPETPTEAPTETQ